MRLLFFTDIHQNIEAVKGLNFLDYDAIFCAGDLINPSDPDLNTAKKIVDILPEKTIIVPGNCDKDETLISYMQEKLNFIHKKSISVNNVPVLGIGYSRTLKDDMIVYRKYFKEDINRVNSFIKNNKFISFIPDFCGIKMNSNNMVEFLSEEEAYKKAKDFIDKFISFTEDEIETLFSEIISLKGGILLTHSPPFGALDKLDGLPNIGSYSITKGIKETKPSIVLCGHFHELFDKVKIDDSIIFNPGAIKDGRYGIVEIDKKEIRVLFKKL